MNIVDEYAEIAKAQRELAPSSMLFAAPATLAEEPYCHRCENGGWEHSWGPEGRGPYFEQCGGCGNPHDYPKPCV